MRILPTINGGIGVAKINIFCVFAVIYFSSHFNFQSLFAEEKAVQLQKLKGYTQKFTLPEAGLDEEERKYLTVAKKINDVLSEETHVAVLSERISPILLEISETQENNQIFIETESREIAGALRDVSRITASNLGNYFFVFGDPLDEIRNGRVKSLRIIFSKDHPLRGTLSKPPPPKGIPADLFVTFHDNGNMAGLVYFHGLLNKVKREVTWSEDGKLLKERVIDTPEPIRITKGTELER